MEHNKIIKDERGEIRIQVRIQYGEYWRTSLPKYDVIVFHKARRKRNEIVDNEAATPQEIYAAKLELWELCKPAPPTE